MVPLALPMVLLRDRHLNGVIPVNSGGNPRLSPIALSPTVITRSLRIQVLVIPLTLLHLILLTLNILLLTLRPRTVIPPLLGLHPTGIL